MKKELQFIFCNTCNKLLKRGVSPLGFHNYHFCDVQCKNEYPNNEKMMEVFRDFWEDKHLFNSKYKVSHEQDLQEVIKLVKGTTDNEIFSLKEKELSLKNEKKKLEKELGKLEYQKDKGEEEVKQSRFGRKVRLNHPDKCERCEIIDGRGNYLWIKPKKEGGEDNINNKIFLCHKCFVSVQAYIDDLINIYGDYSIIRKFITIENSWLDNPLEIKNGT